MIAKIKKSLIIATLFFLGNQAFAQSEIYTTMSDIKEVTCVYMPNLKSLMKDAINSTNFNISNMVGGIIDSTTDLPIDMKEVNTLTVISTDKAEARKEILLEWRKLRICRNYDVIMDVKEDSTRIKIYKHKTKNNAILIFADEGEGISIVQIQ